ncbi:MAG: amidohydrolase family protein [Enterocloster sp.]
MIRDLDRKDLRFIIGPLYGTSFSVEENGKSLSLGAELEKEGVHAAISTGHPEMNLEILSTQLILMTDRGLSRKEAIRGVTAYPAEYMGISSRVGTLEPGKDADLVIWDGDPLEYDGGVKRLFIDGEEIALS